jgi:predicted transport protein
MISMLLIDSAKFQLWTPKDEENEFHPMVREHSKEIFGENSLYFDVKHVLKTVSGIGSIPDAYAINLSKPFEWYVVENELASHPVYDHIVKQLTKFINGIANQNAKSQIIDTLYDEINKDNVLKAIVQKLVDSTDIYRVLSKLLSNPPRIVIIIDEKTSEVEEACQVLKYKTDIVEFKTFVRENSPNIRAHLFEPLNFAQEILEKRDREIQGKKSVPEHYRTWEKKLSWVDENVREIETELKNRIIQFGGVKHKPSGPDYIFYMGEPITKSIFVGLFLTKKALKVRIRTDPATFNDPKKLTGEKIYHWFFRTGQEKEFKIDSTDQMDYAMELIKQSYELAS